MLAQPDKFRCLECTRVYGTPDFAYHEGLIENGPAYWSDRGLLCSPECAVKHHRRRVAEGAAPPRHVPNPLETDPMFRLR